MIEIDEEITKIMTEDPSHPLIKSEPIHEPILPNPDYLFTNRKKEAIKGIFNKRLEESFAYNMQGIINCIKNDYKMEKDTLKCDLPHKQEEEEETSINTNFTLANGSEITESKKQILQEYYDITDDILKEIIIHQFKIYKNEFNKILYNDEEFVNAKAKIEMEVEDKVRHALYGANSEKLRHIKHAIFQEDESEMDEDEDDIQIVENKDVVIEIVDDEDEIEIVDDEDEIEIVDDEDEIEIVEDEDEIQIVENKDEIQIVDDEDEIINKTSVNKPITDNVLQKVSCQREIISAELSNKKVEQIKNNERNVTQKTFEEDLHLRVKLFAYPRLPSNLICEFLKKYNPTSIKSHKTVKNLLIVDFNNKVDYDNILAANESKLGDTKLFILKVYYDNNNKLYVMKRNISKGAVIDNAEMVANEIDAAHKEKEINMNPQETEMEVDDIIVYDDAQTIGDEANERQERTEEQELQGDKQTSEIDNSENINLKTSENSQLVVVLISRPDLPSKQLTSEFLKDFNPASIEKHKIAMNFLRITFNNKNDYDNILAANKSIVGDAVFIIKPIDLVGPVKEGDKYYTIINKSENTMVHDRVSEDSIAVVAFPNKDKGGETEEKCKVKEEINSYMAVDTTGTVEDEQEMLTEHPKEELFDKVVAVKCDADEKRYFDSNVREMMNKKITETITKIGQINKQTNYKLLNCKDLKGNGARAGQTHRSEGELVNKESEQIQISPRKERRKKAIEEAFYKRLNILKDSMFFLLREDREYNAVKSVITNTVKNMNKAKELQDQSNTVNVDNKCK